MSSNTDTCVIPRKEVPRVLADFIPKVEWPLVEEMIQEIQKLKKEKNVLVLAHNYMTPDIFHGIADIRGDSLALAREAVGQTADVILVCGVHFMAETVKVLNPDKTVLIADLDAGCSLAESITPEDVRQLRLQYPGRPIVTYVNTSAAVKAECDICCTSGNAVQIVESLDSDEIVFVPDQYLAAYVATQTKKKIIPWKGSCMVHEEFTPQQIRDYRQSRPGVQVVAHPECPPEVIAEADFAGSTAQMVKFLEQKNPEKVFLITECSMSDNVAMNFPKTEFVRPCNLCPHMKKITLPKILDTLRSFSPQVEVPQEVIPGARRAIEAMLQVGPQNARIKS